MSPNCIPFDPLPQLTQLVRELTEAYVQREKEYNEFIASCDREEEEEERVRREQIEIFDKEIEAQEHELGRESKQAEIQLQEQHRDEHDAMKRRHSAEAENIKDEYEARRASVPARQSKLEFEETWRIKRNARFAERERVRADLIAKNATDNYKRALDEVVRIFDLSNTKNGNLLSAMDLTKKEVKEAKDRKDIKRNSMRSSNHKRPYNSLSTTNGDTKPVVSLEDSNGHHVGNNHIDQETKLSPESTTSTSTSTSKPAVLHGAKRQKSDELSQNYEYLGSIDYSLRLSDVQNYKSMQPFRPPEGGMESMGSILPTKLFSKKEALRNVPVPPPFDPDNPPVTVKVVNFSAEVSGSTTSPGGANASLRSWKASETESNKTVRIRVVPPATATLTPSPSSSSSISTNGQSYGSNSLIRIFIDCPSDPHFSLEMAHSRHVSYDLTTKRLRAGKDEHGSKVLKMEFYDVMELGNCMNWYDERGAEVVEE